jgi:TRAP-type mannitol/chloroaromatic compound transport system permease small subunit
MPRPKYAMSVLGDGVVALTLRLDQITTWVGQSVRWLTLVIPIVCFTYAVVRKLLPWGHNGLSELQWYLFATVYLLAAGYTLLLDQHVRVDFFWRKFSFQTKCCIDLMFLLPLLAICAYLAVAYWDFWIVSFRQQEGPEDVLIGLERWPVKLALFLGFSLLALQCLAESLKRVAVLQGWMPGSKVYAAGGPAGLTSFQTAGAPRPWRR